MAYEAMIPLGAGSRFDLPEVCVVTGERLGLEWHKREFVWTPPWVFVLVLLNVLILVIVAMVVRKKVNLELPYAPGVHQRWRRGVGGYTALVVLTLLATLGGTFLLSTSVLDSEFVAVVLFGFFAALLVAFIVGYWLLVRGRGPRIKKVTKEHVVMLLPSEAAADAINRRFSGLLPASDRESLGGS